MLSYIPLDERQEEIRLINILQRTSDSDFVRCNVVTVSLKSYRSEHEDFLTAFSSTQRSKQDIRTAWTDSSSPPSTQSTCPQSPMTQHIPCESSYRYTWGDYAALSYVWGDTVLTHRIIVNDQIMHVGPNLEIALRALSTSSDFENGFKLWVDAICINQADLVERASQVSKMRDIYGNAWSVVAWLGEEGNRSDDAIWLIDTLSSMQPRHGEELAMRLERDPELLGVGCWMALQDLMLRPYWFRLWIIQELVLGSSSLVLRCGDSFIDWVSFCRGIGFLFDYLWTVKDLLLYRELERFDPGGTRRDGKVWLTTSLHLVHQDLWSLSYTEGRGRAHLRLDRLLNVANSALSADPRDKVYGLVGLMDPHIADQIHPNYEASPAAVYAAVAKIFILTYGNLEPLREGNPWGPHNTPSWAADWGWGGRLRHKTAEKNDLWGPFWTKKGVPELVVAAEPYRASGSSAMEIRFLFDDSHLTCRGFIVDQVASLSARGKGYFEWVEDFIVKPDHLSHMYGLQGWQEDSTIQSDQTNNMYGSDERVSEALYRTLVADRVAGGVKAELRHSAILSLPSTFANGCTQFQNLGWNWLASQEGYYFRWENWRRANRNFILMGRKLDEYFTDQIPKDASEYDYTEVYSCFDRTCKTRRFMTTSRGYMGWAPDNIYGSDEEQTKKGDLIVILFGCSTPIVVRPMGQMFQVMGEAYVQGLMDGEGMELFDTAGFPGRNFTFC